MEAGIEQWLPPTCMLHFKATPSATPSVATTSKVACTKIRLHTGHHRSLLGVLLTAAKSCPLGT